MMRGRLLISLAVPTAALQLGVMQPFAMPAATLRTSPIFLNEKGEGTLSEEDRKAALLGNSESLLECLYDAENPDEVQECRTDFEELLGVPTDACVQKEEGEVCNPSDISVKDPKYKDPRKA